VFGLPNTSQVTIDIYNLQGALVRSLATGTFAAGYQTVTWDGRDNSGQFVSAGTYLYRLQAEGLALTKKMIYLK
jgi:flagellar hook assembly protein FlgD